MHGSLFESVVLVGQLDRLQLERALTPVSDALRSGRCGLLVDCREMTGYTSEARSFFVDWNSAHRARVTRVAILTDNMLWHMIIAAMSLASGQSMKAFADAYAARAWLAAL
jgi:SpoIIAA-like